MTDGLTVLGTVVASAAVVLAFPALMLLLECAASLFGRRGEQLPRPPGASLAVLIPAHDERLGIAATVEGVRAQLEPTDRVLVVADNCTDDTAAIARTVGAEVVEREDAIRRGKGFALEFGLEQLDRAPPDVVLILDADCRLTPGSVDALVHRVVETGRPVQADYVFAPGDGTTLSKVSTLAAIVRNRVRPRGLRRLGQPCHLTGTGMAFPWRVLRDAPALEGHIVEDLALGIELAILGHEPLLCIEAGARSELPRGRQAALQQRRRWEHGHIRTLLREGPRLVRQGVRQRRLSLVALGADLMVPPLALLVSLILAVLGAGALVAFFGGPAFAMWIAAADLAAVGVAIGLGWLRYGRREVPLRYLLFAPLYVLWKVPMYGAYFLGRGERRWRRTER